jgi:type IV pilus assembly protein PilY1
LIATTNIGEDVTPVAGARTWSAQRTLDELGAYAQGSVVGWRDLRRIVTFNGARGVAMRMGNLSSAQQAALGQDGALLDYLRGDRSLEGARFRVRQHLLADVVDSQATLVQGALSPHFDEGANPGYAAFAKRVADRAPVVYVGANDGMVHAFAADFAEGTKAKPFAGGHELFAYVPGGMFAGPTGAPDDTGLAALANLAGATARPYAHHFYVNQTPQAVDIDFGFSATRPGLPATRETPDWHTVLVGGLGKGGRSIYALDITDVPPAVGTASDGEEERIARKVLWEFADADMGYSFARPLVMKTRRYGWVVAVASGYDNPSGHGKLYILSARTGQVLETIDTGAGTAATPAGLARPSGYTRSVVDATVDQVYAGDLLGNVWMFDVSGGDAFPPAELVASLTDTLGRPQPITTAPRIEVDIGRDGIGTRRWVFVGTGRFLSTTDLVDTQPQTMYALRDGTAARPPSHFHPIVRADLKVSDLTTDLGLTDADAGWLYDLPGRAPGIGGATERVVVDPDAVAGIYSISWAGLVPTADPCSLKGAIYSVDYGSGRSVLIGADGKPLDRLETASAVTQLQMVRLPSGEITLLYGQTGSQPGTVNIRQPDEGGDVRRTNWREILR